MTQVLEAVNAKDVVQLGAGVPSTDLLPVKKLNRMLSSAARRYGDAAVEYAELQGSMSLRRALSRRALEWGLTVSPSEVIITNGGMESLALALRVVTKAGDAIAIESPTYFGFIELLQQLGLKAVEIPTHPREGLCLDALERAVRTRRIKACLAIPNFNNPLGSLMPDEAKARLVQMLAQRDIPLIEDDLYGDLHFDEGRPSVAKRFDKTGLVLLCGSFSKTVAPGYRVGWLMAGRFFERAKSLKSTTSGPTAALPQLALADYLTHGGYDHHLRSLREALKGQVEKVSHAVSNSFPSSTKVTRPQGGFVLWIELPAGIDAIAIHKKALRHNISIAPGPMFSPQQGYSNFIRLSCGQCWSPEIDEAIIRLSSLVTAM